MSMVSPSTTFSTTAVSATGSAATEHRQAVGHFHRGAAAGLAALLDYARPGEAIVVVGIDRLSRDAAEVMTTIRELGERGIGLRYLREGIDTSNATGRMVAGVLASLAELELELGASVALLHRALDRSKVRLARRMHDRVGEHNRGRAWCTPCDCLSHARRAGRTD